MTDPHDVLGPVLAAAIEALVDERVNTVLARRLQRDAVSPWLTAEQLADRLGWPAKRIRNLTTANRLPHHRVGRRVLYAAAEVDEWVRSQ